MSWIYAGATVDDNGALSLRFRQVDSAEDQQIVDIYRHLCIEGQKLGIVQSFREYKCADMDELAQRVIEDFPGEQSIQPLNFPPALFEFYTNYLLEGVKKEREGVSP